MRLIQIPIINNRVFDYADSNLEIFCDYTRFSRDPKKWGPKRDAEYRCGSDGPVAFAWSGPHSNFPGHDEKNVKDWVERRKWGIQV